LRHAVTAGPDNAAAQAALAGWLNQHGHTREAIHHFELAQKLHPSDTATRIGLARALSDAAKLADAERQLDAIPATDPKHTDALVERGRILLRRNRFADADALLEQATVAAPWHRDAHRLRLIASKELGRADALKPCEAKIAELIREDAIAGPLKLKARDAGGDVPVRVALWEWAKRNGQPDEEVAWLAEILRVAPKHLAAHAAFADYFDRAGQPRRAALHRITASQK
jgi:tetratricopeptide (TPR) repeat protein